MDFFWLINIYTYDHGMMLLISLGIHAFGDGFSLSFLKLCCVVGDAHHNINWIFY